MKYDYDGGSGSDERIFIIMNMCINEYVVPLQWSHDFSHALMHQCFRNRRENKLWIILNQTFMVYKLIGKTFFFLSFFFSNVVRHAI